MRLIIDIRKYVGKVHDNWDGEMDGTFTKHLNKQLPRITRSLLETAALAQPNQVTDVTVKLDVLGREASLTMHGAERDDYILLQQLFADKDIPTILWGATR